MRQPIQPIRDEQMDAYVESIRAYVEDRFLAEFSAKLSDAGSLLDVTAQDRRDHVKVSAFFTDGSLVPEAAKFAHTVTDDLDSAGHRVFIYVRTWTLPADQG